MPVTYETLYDVETAVETAVKGILTTAGIVSATSFETGDLPGTRVDAVLWLGAATGNQRLISAGNSAYAAWEATLKLQIYTPASASTTHATTRAKIRKLMQYFSGAFTTVNLPYHSVIQIRDAGTIPSESENQMHCSELSFSCVVGIRETAWALV